MNKITPIFPCKSLDELLAFYQSLGFEVTYYQKSPNPYAVVERGWITLHFYGIKHHDPKSSFHTCGITTDEVDSLYEEFANVLRNKNGNLPTRGLPRLNEIRDKPRDGVREFHLVDIAGTYLRFGKKIESTLDANENYSQEVVLANNRLSLALDFAYHKQDEEDELEKVSQVLDKAIEKDKTHPCINLYKVMTLRADLAVEMRDYSLAEKLLQEVRTSEFITNRKDEYKAELRRVTDIEKKLKLALDKKN
jgi:hypothetical protein